MPVEKAPQGVDTRRPSIARVYDAMLGGKDNFDVDRVVLEQMLASVPDVLLMARDNRMWVRRVARWLATEAGIDQFLDVGSGLPTVENTHEVVQRVDPDTCVVYVDNDPAVIAHGRVLLADDERTFFASGDLTKPEELLADPAIASHLDLTRPMGLLHCLTLHHVGDEGAHRIVRGYVDRLAPGSYLAVSHIRLPEPDDARLPGMMGAVARYQSASPEFTARRLAGVEALLTGLELVEPGVVPVGAWWPEGPPVGEPHEFADFLVGGVARKP